MNDENIKISLIRVYFKSGLMVEGWFDSPTFRFSYTGDGVTKLNWNAFRYAGYPALNYINMTEIVCISVVEEKMVREEDLG